MGIKGLWKLVSPAGQSMTLHRLAIQEGFVENVGGGRAYRIGIDASGWIYAASYHHSSTKSPELATLFARCARLVELPVHPLFVFDGPGRPQHKRKKMVRGNDHWSTVDFKKMLTVFGFSYLEAPAEAEAELACQSKAGLLDAVITEDSDTFVFGVRTVVRLCPNFCKTGMVEVYHASQIAELGYDTSALVLIALLVSGDYSEGIIGCGMETAQHVVKSGLGARLLAGPHTHGGLLVFRNILCTELSRDSPDLHRARCHCLLDAIPPVFPDLTIFNLYVHPSTTEHAQPDLAHHCQELDLVALALFAEENFVWGDTAGILKRFAQQIFPGIAVHELVRSAAAMDLGLHWPSCRSISRLTHHQKNSPEREAEMRAVLNSDTPIKGICKAIKGTHNVSSTPNSVEEFTANVHCAWLPTVMLQVAVPELVMAVKGAVPGVAGASDSGTSLDSIISPPTNMSQTMDIDITVPKPPLVVIDLTSPSPEPSAVPCHKPLTFIDLTSLEHQAASNLPVSESSMKSYRVEVSLDGAVLEFFSDSDGDV